MGLGQTITVGKENAGGHDQTVTVTHDQSMSVGNDQDSKVTGNDTEAVEKSQTVTVGETLTVTVGDAIEFVCGKSTLRMDKDGYITINGHELSLGTTGEQYYKADGDINLQAKTILEN